MERQRSISSCKRGFSDGIFWGIFLLIAGIVIVVGMIVITQVNNAIQATELNDTAKGIVSDFAGDFPGMFDALFVMFFIALLLGSMVLSLFVDTNPALFAVGFIVFILVLVLGGFFSNAFIDFAEDDTISMYANQFPMTLFIFNNFVLILVGYLGIMGVVIYGKLRS